MDMDTKTLIAAQARGMLQFRISKIARAADLSEATVRRWLSGGEVSQESEAAIKHAMSGPLSEPAPKARFSPGTNANRGPRAAG